jgi:hypothetical protein
MGSSRIFGRDYTRKWSVRNTGWTAGVGAGAKIFLTNQLFVAPEARFGGERIVGLGGRIG